MRAPLFTRENAAEMARRANAAKKRNRLEMAAKLAAYQAQATDDSRTQRTRQQLAKLDDEIETALVKRHFDRLAMLTLAKDRLWKLVTPTAGAMRPRAKSTRPAPPVAQ